MELTNLYYFKVTAEVCNITKAAALLNISQPALSRAIARLEASLGVKLFERYKGRLSLSDTGKNYYGFIAKAFTQIEAADNYIKTEKESADAMVSIATTASELLSTLAVDFYTRGPASDVKLRQLNLPQSEIIGRLHDNTLDFAITCEPVDDKELDSSVLLTEEVFLLISREHPLAKFDGKEVSLTALKGQRFLVNESVLDSEAVRAYCRLGGFEPDIFISCSESEVLRDALRHIAGISLAPASKLANQMEGLPEELAIVRIEGRPLKRNIYYVRRADKVMLRNVHRFASHTKGYFRRLSERIESFPMGYFADM